MSRYITPGLYFETVDNARDDVNPARVDIPAFLGIASQGPVHQPTQINSQAQFQAIFGSFIPNSYLAYVVKAFFENGGTRCYVVRVAASTAKEAFIELKDTKNQKTLTITASSPGSWGNNLILLLTHSSNFATQTLPPPPPGVDRRNIFVTSTTGFAPGTLVRFFQAGSTIAYHVVVASFAQQKILQLDSPLEDSYKLNDPISLETVEFALTVYVAGNISEIFPSLSLVDYVVDQDKKRVDNPRYIERVINAGGSLLISVKDEHSTTPLPDSFPALIGAGGVALIGGYDGLADLTLTDMIGDPTSDEKRGLRTLEDVRDVATIAMPDLTLQPTLLAQPPLPLPASPDPCLPNNRPLPVGKPLKPHISEVFNGFSLEDVFQAQQAMIDFCEQQRRCIALLDPPVTLLGNVFNVATQRIVQQKTAVRQVQSDIFAITEIQGWRQRFDSKYAALYYPQLLVYDPLKLGGQVVRAIPPCGHVAGMFARVDAETGPHRAPANEELSWVQGVNVAITAAVQGILNPQGINCIRTFAGRGIRIYGARTLSNEPSWIYVNVRRLMNMLERSLEASMQWVAFEPNNFVLRQTLVLNITTFLEAVWASGALVGAKATDAFFVKCDDQNNPSALADLGQLVVEIGVAPVIPAEFVILRIGITQDELEVTG